MFTIIFEWLKDYSPSLLFVFFSGYVIWHISRFYSTHCCKQREDLKNTNKEFEEIKKDGRERGKKLDTLISVVSNLCTTLSVKEIIPYDFYRAKSPLSLTDLGRELLIDSGASETYKDVKNMLMQKVISESPYNTYLDLENACFSVILNYSNDKAFNTPKNFVYQNPVYKERPLMFENIVKMLSILLRDDILKEHKNIVTSSLEKEDL